MKVLVLVSDRINPSITATRVRNKYLWPAVAAQKVQIKILGLDHTPYAEDSPNPTELEASFFSYNNYSLSEKITNAILYSYHQWPYSLKLQNAVVRAIKDWKPDIIHAEELKMAAYIPPKELLHKHKVLSSLAIHNMESNLIRATGSSPIPIIRPIIEFIHYLNLVRFERKAIINSDLIFAYSDIDKELYLRKYRKGVWAQTQGGSDVSNVTPSPQASKPSVLIVGSLNYRPNIEGILWFLDKVKPMLPPSFSVTIAGSNPTPKLRERLLKEDIRFIDTPANLDDLYRSHAVCAVPLFKGSGTRGKIIEALAQERAIVTTHKGAEGLELKKGEGVVIADSPESFAKKITLLVENKKERSLIAKSGRRRVAKVYDWPIVAKRLIIDWEKLLLNKFK